MADDDTDTTADDVSDATGVPADVGGDDSPGGEARAEEDGSEERDEPRDTSDGDDTAADPESTADGDDTAAEPDDTSDGEDTASEAEDVAEGASEASAPEGGPAGGGGDDFDFDAAERRLEGVEEKIEEGRRALADVEQDVEPDQEGPPIAEGEGAANAPPG